jgi:hypothetical protein
MSNQPVKVRTKEWLTVYNACLKEFSVWEFGKEAYDLAANAADKIIEEDKEKHGTK